MIATAGPDGRHRCPWGNDPDIYRRYHDDEWGRPVDDDVALFEKLVLEGFQAGLSWLTILNKRDAFREAFAGFDPDRVAAFDESDVERLVGDAGIVRHRGKIQAAIANAARAVELRDEFGSLGAFFWSYEPVRTGPSTAATSPESIAMSKELKRRGFRFVGPTTAYAFMQAMGIVNDHLDGCWVREDVERLRATFVRPTGP